jgi:ABC-2 type transport system permease protein
MNRNLYLKELRMNSTALILWMVAITLLVTLTMSMFNTFIENQSKVIGMMKIVPKGALQFKGISNFEDLFSVLGFYAVNNVIYMMVLGSIYAIVLSSNILLKEEYNRTAEYLLTRPVTRSEVFLSKLAVVLLNIFLLNLVAALAGFFSMEIVKNAPINFKPFLILSFYTLLLNLLFGTLGLFISTLVKRSKPVTTLCIGLVLILYFIYTISKITTSASAIGYVSPFKYINIDVVHPGYGLELWRLGYFIILSLILGGIAYRLYLKKDLYI